MKLEPVNLACRYRILQEIKNPSVNGGKILFGG